MPGEARIEFKVAKLRVWQKAVPRHGGWLATQRSERTTHVLVSGQEDAAILEALAAAPAGAAPPLLVVG